MSSSSSSSKKRPDLDRRMLTRALKSKITNLKATTKHYIRTRQYGLAEGVSAVVMSSEYLLHEIDKGLYDVLPKGKQ
jgi:hypothetical protein